MVKKLVIFLVALTAVGAVTLSAQENGSKASEGTLIISKKTSTFTHALAYETTIDDENEITVVLTASTISGEKLKEAKEKDKENGTPDFKHPFIKLEFKKTGS